MAKLQKTSVCMDTFIEFQVIDLLRDEKEIQDSIQRAIEVFQTVEKVCNRFDPNSELTQFNQTTGKFVQLSPILYEAIQFGYQISQMTKGVFNIAVGAAMKERGIIKNYQTGERFTPRIENTINTHYQKIKLNQKNREALLEEPTIVDLGAVAKGFAVDLAAKELEKHKNFTINAGGDVYVSGRNEENEPWNVYIQDPKNKTEFIKEIQIGQGGAVCTTGEYERPGHILKTKDDLLSCTVISPHAMISDALSTATFAMGLKKGMQLIRSLGLEAVFVTADHKIKEVKS